MKGSKSSKNFVTTPALTGKGLTAAAGKPGMVHKGKR